MEKKQILEIIAVNLRNLLNRENLSSADLARICKVSAGTVSKILNADMSITIPMAINLANGLNTNVDELLNGLSASGKKKKISSQKNEENARPELHIGVLSINNKRFTCVKDASGIVGTSELENGLDLTETTSGLIQLIQESIAEALPDYPFDQALLKNSSLNLVMQSFEFEDTRIKFIHFARKYFKEVMLLPDWQISYLAAFKNASEPGISLVIDKGISLSYMNDQKLKKLGGWKFPVYDIGGENWLGVETIRHTIEAAEGYIPMTELAHTVLSKFNHKIERITETCFKRPLEPDIYCVFADLLLRRYWEGDKAAKNIIENGFELICRSIALVDKILGTTLKISIDGSLAEIYTPFFKKTRLTQPSSDAEKVTLLADLTKTFLMDKGIRNN